MNVSETVRDRTILSEFLNYGVVEEYSVQKGKKLNFGQFW